MIYFSSLLLLDITLWIFRNYTEKTILVIHTQMLWHIFKLYSYSILAVELLLHQRIFVFQIMIIIALLLSKKFVLIFTHTKKVWECLFSNTACRFHKFPNLKRICQSDQQKRYFVVVLICMYLIMCEVEHFFCMFINHFFSVFEFPVAILCSFSY